MSDEISAVEEDKKKHPHCNYSTSFQKFCRSLNGDSSCEDIKRVLRVCPGERPVEIFNKSDKKGEDSSHFWSFGARDERGFRGKTDESGMWDFGMGHNFPADIFSLFESDLRGIFPNIIGNDRSASAGPESKHKSAMQPPITIAPPHRVPKGQNPVRSSSSPHIDGYATGESESI